jgi:D-alanyl-D-alanine carboxypeptidase
MRIKEPERLDVLVNKDNWLPKDFECYDLIRPKIEFLPDTIETSRLMRYDAAKALEKLFLRAKRAGIKLYAVSGYRSFKRQREIFKSNYEKDGERANKYSARPGQSEHQTGLAMDVTCSDVNYELSEDFENTLAYKWLLNNMHSFGFILRYPKDKESITGYMFEPWHLRYVGKDLANKLYQENMVLEEYVKKFT